MKLTTPTSALFVVALIGFGVVAGRLTPPLIVRFDGNPPRLGWSAPVFLLGGAVAVGYLAHSTWQSLHKRRERMTSEHGIRMLSLAKASAVVGALVGGYYGGFALAFIGELDVTLGKERFIRALAAAVAGLFLLAAGLLLERACRLPDDDEDDDDPNSGPGSLASH